MTSKAKPVKPEKKKHHYIPQTYLEAFTNENGKLFCYRKDTPQNPLPLTPDNVAHRRYYYSQPIPEGGQDNDSLEDAFSEIEGAWPVIMKRISEKSALSAEEREKFFQFIGLLRVRVPAIRDAIELMRAELVKMTLRALDKQGKLPPKPDGFEDLLEHTVVSIDPHQSILAMPHLMKGFAKLLSLVGFEIFFNKTDIPLITNDNPVMVIDPSVPEDQMQPYRVSPDGPVEIIVPLSPLAFLYGHSSFTRLYQRQFLWYEDCRDVGLIKRINRLTAKFGYEAVFASTEEHASLIERNSGVSPVPEFRILPKTAGEFLLSDWKFGPRPVKEKWKKKKAEEDS